MVDFIKDFGQRLNALRTRKGYLLMEVARLCRVDYQTILAIESGEMLPCYSLFDDICRTLGITTSQFMSVYRWTFKGLPINVNYQERKR